MEEIGKRLKELRRREGKSQEEIAQIINTTQQYYGQYEKGKRPIPPDRLRELCIHYGVSANYILGLSQDLEWPK